MQAKITNHAAEDRDLGGIFLTEVGAVWLGGGKELGDDGGDAAEMSGAGFAVKAIAEAFHLDKGGGAGRIHLLGGGGEEGFSTFPGGELEIGGERAGIAGEVFFRAELPGIDEESDDDEIAGFGSGANERGMTGVERAHGGHECNASALRTLLTHALSQFGNGTQKFHQAGRTARKGADSARGLSALRADSGR